MTPEGEGWGEWGRYVLEELKRLNASLLAVQKDLAELRKEREGKVSSLEVDLDRRLREAETEIARLNERLKVLAIVQTAFTSVAATLAGWLGMKG